VFLHDHADFRNNFFRFAVHVWPRHLRDLSDEITVLERADAGKKA
jgi:hypothetical protein